MGKRWYWEVSWESYRLTEKRKPFIRLQGWRAFLLKSPLTPLSQRGGMKLNYLKGELVELPL